MIQIVPRTGENPFPANGISRDEHGIAHYDDLPSSLIALLRGHAEATPGAEAVVEIGGARLTYRDLFDQAARVAGGLRAGGLEAGDRVALRYPAGVSWVVAFWGTVLAGGVPVAVNTRLTAPEVEFVLGDAGVSVDLDATTPLPDGPPFVGDAGPDDLAALFYTSGTTGRPKGVPTTHHAFLSNAENMIRCMGIGRDAGAAMRTLISVPLFHVTGCNSQLLVAAYVGGTAVIMPTLDLGQLAEVVGGERISFLVTVPAVYALLLRNSSLVGADLSAVRWVGYGGAPIATSLVRKLQEAFPRARVFNGYGMTETASLLTVLPHEDAAEHADSVGYAVPVVDLAIDPLDGPDHGELLARGPNVTAGYWNRPDATADTITDGWLHTGDIVRVDAAGRIAIVDRAKDIINRGGENVSSVEVEDVLSDAPGVAEVAVIGVPDEVMGEKVGAVLVGDGLDVDKIIAHASTRLADFKLPPYVTIVDGPLPRTAAGKLRKDQLRHDTVWGPPLR
ncbi:AMP-binding protein [Actinocrispum sp. NPDC049592]|uniref:class I adenylate-forming enzyme family protein n=1 Tax=Actinocrispum sp. NPDC049592 TaxID=3154835 RepID=UPI00342EF7F9